MLKVFNLPWNAGIPKKRRHAPNFNPRNPRKRGEKIERKKINAWRKINPTFNELCFSCKLSYSWGGVWEHSQNLYYFIRGDSEILSRYITAVTDVLPPTQQSCAIQWPGCHRVPCAATPDCHLLPRKSMLVLIHFRTRLILFKANVYLVARPSAAGHPRIYFHSL
jgi:hypothetical protein